MTPWEETRLAVRPSSERSTQDGYMARVGGENEGLPSPRSAVEERGRLAPPFAVRGKRPALGTGSVGWVRGQGEIGRDPPAPRVDPLDRKHSH